jgi:hypothetical protein
MKIKIVCFCVILFLSLITSAQKKQDSSFVKKNPIVFADLTYGYTDGYLKGLSVAGSINYQKTNNLYTFRALATFDFRNASFISIIPVSGVTKSIEEYSLLYGKRFVKDGFSYHFSGGISYNVYLEKERDYFLDEYVTSKNTYVGFPLEIGVNFFKSKKERYRVLYGLIPVGKPTSFGKSLGIKFYANIAKKTYVGIGFSFGLGWHKYYINEK